MNLVFDIETVGFDFGSLDESQQEFILRYAEKEKDEEVKKEKADEAKRLLSLYPFTAKVISIGLLRTDTESSLVLFEGEEREWQNEEEKIKYKAASETEMLKLFWDYVEKADKIVSFNGRQFDIPFLMIRSAINKIKPSRNFLRSRFDHNLHIDLLEEFTFHGLIKKFNLDFYCKAFGIESPKSHGVTGMDVKELYDAGRTDELAVYCGNDIRATFKLFQIWENYLQFK